MKRRSFIAGAASAGLLAGAGWPRTATAQAPDRPVIGWLDGAWGGRLRAGVGRALQDSGFDDGKRVRFEFSRWNGSEFRADQIAKYAAELVSRQVALIIAASNKAALAASTATSTIPIVFLSDDPVALGLVSSLDRPGGNLTGVVRRHSGLVAKRIAIARRIVPEGKLVVLATDPTDMPAHDTEVREARAASEAEGFDLAIIAWTGERSIEAELAELPRDRKAVLVAGDGLPFLVRAAYLAYIATLYGASAIHGNREAADEGGLASFGTRYADCGYQMGILAARILNGDRPAQLPLRQVAATELVINRGVARSRGLVIPVDLLAGADEVIE
jgi:putative ABC transport system substrate-binding protein